MNRKLRFLGRQSIMIEIRIHGRGGQGNVVAAYLLAAAAIKAGFHAQGFPAFGAERRGAPVAAFVRMRKSPIRRRCEVETPDVLIVQDPTLLRLPATLEGVAPKSGILVNTGRRHDLEGSGLEGYRVVKLPATEIAERAIGRPIPNVPLLGAFVALSELFPLDMLHAALAERFDAETTERNWDAVNEATTLTTAGAWRELVDAHAD